MNDDSLPGTEAPNSPSTKPPPDYRRVVWSLLLGGLLGLMLTLVTVRWLNYDPTPPLEPADFYAARDKWKQHAPASYNIEVQVSGSQPARYRVEVRDGQAIAAFRNGRPLTQQRTFGTWSVPGMFATMSRDVENVERHAAGRADAFTPELTLRAAFDPQYSYPQTYKRIQWGADVEVSWSVIKFEVVALDTTLK